MDVQHQIQAKSNWSEQSSHQAVPLFSPRLSNSNGISSLSSLIFRSYLAFLTPIHVPRGPAEERMRIHLKCTAPFVIKMEISTIWIHTYG